MRRWILLAVTVVCHSLVCLQAPAQFSLLSREIVYFPAPYLSQIVGPALQPVVGDFNNDGHPDIVLPLVNVTPVSNGATYVCGFAVMLGDSHGGFQTLPAVFPANDGVNSLYNLTRPGMFAGDFNGDGNLDLVLFQSGDRANDELHSSALLYPGNGDGSFKEPVDISKYVGPSNMAVLDVRGNGFLDLVSQANTCSLDGCSSGPITVAYGNGDGTFQDVSNIASSSKIIGDYGWSEFDLGNGHPDILGSVGFGDGFLPLLGNGNGTFQELPVVGLFSPKAAFGRFIRGHPPSIVVANQDHFEIHTGEDGTFPAVTNLGYIYDPLDGQYLRYTNFAVGDLNGDGIDDIAFLAWNPYIKQVSFHMYVGWLLGNGDGTFAPAQLFDAPKSLPFYPSLLELADLTGSGRLDLIATYVGSGNSSNSIWIFFNNQTTTTLTTTANPQIFSNPVTLKADVSGNAVAPSGNPIDFTGGVSFFDNGKLLGRRPVLSGAATFENLILSAGTHSLTANYTGDLVFSPSAPAALSQVVNGIPTTISLISSAGTINHDDSVTFTATITAPNEPLGKLPNRSTGIGLYFYSDGKLLTGRPVDASGTARFTTTTLHPGTHQITVKYLGDSYWAPGTSNIVTEQVN